VFRVERNPGFPGKRYDSGHIAVRSPDKAQLMRKKKEREEARRIVPFRPQWVSAAKRTQAKSRDAQEGGGVRNRSLADTEDGHFNHGRLVYPGQASKGGAAYRRAVLEFRG
jgi:hypothetical protein